MLEVVKVKEASERDLMILSVEPLAFTLLPGSDAAGSKGSVS